MIGGMIVLFVMSRVTSSFVSTSDGFEEFLGGLNTTTTEEEICQMEIFEGRCPDGQMMLIRSALLGRIKLGKCVSPTFGHIGCYKDVLPEMEMYCSGKSTCSVKIDDQSFKRGMPCHKELKNNLWIKYTCLPVVIPPSGCEPIKVTSSGFLSSHVAHKAVDGCGGLERPWRLEADDGLQINLTMIDFAFSISKLVQLEARKSNKSESSHNPNYQESCRVYAIIREPQQSSSGSEEPLELSRVTTICGWSERISKVFLSSRNKLKIGLSRSHHVTSSDGFQPMGGGSLVSNLQNQRQPKFIEKRHTHSESQLNHHHHHNTHPHESPQNTINKRIISKRSYQTRNGRYERQLHPPQKRSVPAASAPAARVVGRSNGSVTSGVFQYTTQPQAEFIFYFKVLGCANPSLGEGMWMRRNRNLLVIGCHEGKYHDTWTLTCVEDTWQGNYGDCSSTGILNMSDNANISTTAIFILGIAVLVSIVILIGGIICIRRIHPTSNHCQVRCLRDHYADVNASGGYGTSSSTTPSCNKLHVTGSCQSDYGGSGNDYARMRLQQRFNNYPGDYSSMASLMTYEPTRAPTFQTNVASGSIQPLHFGISGDTSYPQEGNIRSPKNYPHAIIDGKRLRHIQTGVAGQFGISCGNLGQQKSVFVSPSSEGMDGSAHHKSASEPYPLLEGQMSPMVMEHIYESPDTLLLKRKEIPRDSPSAVDVCSASSSKNVSFDVGVLKPAAIAIDGLSLMQPQKMAASKNVVNSEDRNALENNNMDSL